VAVPVGVFLGSIYALYTYLVSRFDPFHAWLLIGTAGVVALAVAAAFAGTDMAICLIILMLAPVVTIVGYESLGHSYQRAALGSGGGALPKPHLREHTDPPLPQPNRQ
jgi:hypothetical protein